MADVHLYFGLEILSMTNPQRDLLVANVQALGQRNGGLPHLRNHWRIRSDNAAAIFEAMFDENNLNAAAMTAWLAAIFGIAQGTITNVLTTPTFGTRQSQVLTFTHSSVQRLRSVAFGGIAATREQSKAEALAYLAANAAAWAT